MILGVGIDIVSIKRIESLWNRYGFRFLNRILTQQEARAIPKNVVEFLASRFAAKEAGVKALGTGFSQGITLKSLGVSVDEKGKPSLFFEGRALFIAQQLGVKRIHLSITHTKESAGAVVILED